MPKTKQAPGVQMAAFRRVLTYIRRHLPMLIFSLALALVSVALTLYVPILVGRAVDCMVSGAVDFTRLASVLTTIGVCIGITALCQWVQSIINNRITYTVVR